MFRKEYIGSDRWIYSGTADGMEASWKGLGPQPSPPTSSILLLHLARLHRFSQGSGIRHLTRITGLWRDLLRLLSSIRSFFLYVKSCATSKIHAPGLPEIALSFCRSSSLLSSLQHADDTLVSLNYHCLPSPSHPICLRWHAIRLSSRMVYEHRLPFSFNDGDS